MRWQMKPNSTLERYAVYAVIIYKLCGGKDGPRGVPEEALFAGIRDAIVAHASEFEQEPDQEAAKRIQDAFNSEIAAAKLAYEFAIAVAGPVIPPSSTQSQHTQ